MTLTTSRPHSALRLPLDLRLTPEQFGLVCAENREAVLELDADGRLIATIPTGSETGSRNGELFFQLKLYAKRAGGWKAWWSAGSASIRWCTPSSTPAALPARSKPTW